MKTYFLRPADGRWLSPSVAVTQLRAEFDHVVVDAEAARAEARRFLSRLEFIATGLGGDGTIEEVRARYDGALLAEVWLDSEGSGRVSLLICNQYRLEPRFSGGISGRSRRGVAVRIAACLGYEVVSVDGD